MFIILLNFSSSFARAQTKCTSLNDKPCMIRSTLIGLSTTEPKYYPFIISLDKCGGCCIVLSPKIFVPKNNKNVKINKIKIP